MNRITILLFIVLLCCRCTTAQNNIGEFPKKINVIVKDRDNNIVKNKTVNLAAAYYRRMSLEEDYFEYYRVTTNMAGEATVIRGTGYKREGSYDTIQKLLNERNYANMHLFLLDDKEYAIKELGIFRPEWNEKLLAARRQAEEPKETRQVVEEPPSMVNEVITEDDLVVADTAKSILNFSNWYFVRYDTNTIKKPIIETAPKKGYFERVASGLKMYTGTIIGNWTAARKQKDLAGHTVYVRWKAETNGHVCEMNWKLYEDRPDSPGAFLSSNSLGLLRFNWPGGSTVAIEYKNCEWLYTRIFFEKEGWVSTYTSTGNYDNRGGQLINEQRNNCSFSKGYFGWRLDDLKNVKNSWVIVGDVQFK